MIDLLHEDFGNVPVASHGLPYSAPGVLGPLRPQDLRFARSLSHLPGGVITAKPGRHAATRRPSPPPVAELPRTGCSATERSEVLRQERTGDPGCGAPEAVQRYRDLSKMFVQSPPPGPF